MPPWAQVFDPLVLVDGAVWEIMELLAGTVSLEEMSAHGFINFKVL